MAKKMLIDAQHPEETRVVIADENQIYDFDFISTGKKQLKGNIYLAKITRVEPSLQAAFVEYGGGKQGFLPFSEIHADYYQIPVSDRRRLMEEAQAEDASEESSETQPGQSDTASLDHGGQEQTDSASSESFDSEQHNDSQERPAYLMQEAVDVSVSEYVESGEGNDNLPISQALGEVSEVAGHEQGVPTDTEGHNEHAIENTESDTPSEGAAPEAQSSAEGVETLTSEEDEYQSRPKRNVFLKRYKIQEVIRRGQIVLVQVIKEERGNKGCSLTTYLSLAGRYCVLMPNSPKDGGISRKIANAEDRKRLKAISNELRLAQGMSVIVRTAGMDRTRAEIKRDFDYLVKLWNQIREDTLKSNAPALIYEESDIIKRAIRDQYTSDIDELIVEGEEGFNSAREFMKLLLPSHTPKIKQHKEATPLFYAYGVEEQLLSMHDPVVKLKSGGYIVINPTEALISVDVNSGRATGERNIEETALKTNVEAAAEVARQLRLRDLAGLIVIDFIDMMESRNRRAVEKMLKDSLKADRAKIQLGRISPFGLLEMSRQRLRPSISESNMVQCPHCIGRGVIRSNESMSIQMIRAIEKEASTGTWSGLRLIAPQAVALHLLNTKRDVLRAIEIRHVLTIQVLIDTDMTSSEFNLEKMRRNQGEANNDRRPRRQDRPERNERQERNDRYERRNHELAADEALAEVPGEGETEGAERNESFQNGERPERGERKRRRRGGRNRNRNRDRDRDRSAEPASEGTESDALEPYNSEQSSVPVEATIEQGERPQCEPRQGDANRDGRDRNRDGRDRNRGGRGRRRWRDRDGRESDPNAVEGQAQPNPYERPVNTDGNSLPAFATDERPVVEPPPPPAIDPYVNQNLEHAQATGTEGGGKKGWWQKMIELDD